MSDEPPEDAADEPASEAIDDPLSGVELDLASLAAASMGDALLADVASLATIGVGTAVGLLVNGMVVVGVTTSPDPAVDALDEHRSQVVNRTEQPSGIGEEEWARIREFFGSENRYAYEKAQADEAATASAVQKLGRGNDPRGLPADLARRVIWQSERVSLTLQEVRVVLPGHPAVMQLPLMRVSIRHVAAWWLVPLDEQGRASFQLFG